MISAFASQGALHVVYSIISRGLGARATAFCSAEGDAGAGLYQVPAWAFDGRAAYNTLPACAECGKRYRLAIEPPKAPAA